MPGAPEGSPRQPEEVVRQLWLYRLLHGLKYPASRLQVEYPVTFGRDTSKRADIGIFDVGKKASHFFTLEKKPTRCTKYVSTSLFTGAVKV